MTDTAQTAPTDGGPPVLLHFHQFKNGGSTLDWILQRNFGNGFTEHHGKGEMAALRAPEIEQMLQASPGFRVYSSHHFRPPLPPIPGLMALWLIRHPLDRVLSIYEQERRSAPQGADAPPFPDFLAWFTATRDKRSFLFCDSQTVLIGNSGRYYAPPTQIALQKAIRELEMAPFVGIVDDYDRSMVALEALLRRWWPQFDAAYLQQNDSKRSESLEDRLLDLQDRLGAKTYDDLARRNALDLALYRHARRHLALACKRIPDLESRVADLRQRSEALKAASIG